MTSASTTLPSVQVKLLNCWSWATYSVPRAPSQFPNYVDLRGQSHLANVRIKGRIEASKHCHKSLTHMDCVHIHLGGFPINFLKPAFLLLIEAYIMYLIHRIIPPNDLVNISYSKLIKPSWHKLYIPTTLLLFKTTCCF